MTYEEAFLLEFEKLAGMQPGSLSQQMTSQHDKISPLVLAKLMRDREDSMNNVQMQFNQLFSKSSAQMDPNLKTTTSGEAKSNDEYNLLSRDDVSSKIQSFRSQYDTTPSGGAQSPQFGMDIANPGLGQSQQTPTKNDLSPQTSISSNTPPTSGGVPMPDGIKSKPGKAAGGGVPTL